MAARLIGLHANHQSIKLCPSDCPTWHSIVFVSMTRVAWLILSFLLLSATCVICSSNSMPKLDFDPYEALGVPRQATKSEIRRAFRKLVSMCVTQLPVDLHSHLNSIPINLTRARLDVHGSPRSPLVSSTSEAEFVADPVAAYEVLGDPDKRVICMLFD